MTPRVQVDRTESRASEVRARCVPGSAHCVLYVSIKKCVAGVHSVDSCGN
jgi:hypothetical protein